MKEKKCTKCKKVKDIAEFSKHGGRKDGLQSYCIKCKNIYYLENKEDILLKCANYQKENSEKIKEKHRLYYLKNQKDILLRTKLYKKKNLEQIKKRKCLYYLKNQKNLRKKAETYREENSEKIKDARRMHYIKHKDEINATSKKWREENKEYNMAYIVAYRRNKRATDPIFKVLDAIRNRQSNFFSHLKNKLINNQEIKKSASFHELLGCNEDKFIKHMESKFTPEMNWSNHGTHWHVDHIKPLIAFDFTDSNEQRLACNYMNLQPLTVKENLKKGASWLN